jgi:hypothetical protein
MKSLNDMNLKLVLILPFFFALPLMSQTGGENLFKLVEIRTDTFTFNSNRHVVTYNNEQCLYFIYDDENQIAEIDLFPISPFHSERISVLPSGDFEIMDSLKFYDNAWRCKIRFHNLTHSQFLKLEIKASADGLDKIEVIRLLPCTSTTVSMKPVSDELFIGEEKVFDLVTNRAENLRFSTEWTSGLAIDYRIEKVDDQFRLHLMPNELGIHSVKLSFQAEKPFVDVSSNLIKNQLAPLVYSFNVKTSRLKYLNVDRHDITIDENSRRQGTEVQLDNARQMELNRTYRIEDQENPGGTLIAELFTRSYLSTNKVLCYLRSYNYHRSSEGYLYIKNGDEALFITNFNITPATSLTKMSVMHAGGDWTSDLSVYPGETIQVKIEGQALNKAKFHFEELTDVTTDSLILSENEVNLKFLVPLGISKKRVVLYNSTSPTAFALNVKEYEIPRPFDYININYGDMNHTLSGLHGPILYSRTVRDVVISFNADRIDSDNKLYGRQYLTFDIRVTGPNNELIDLRTINNIVVCPSDNSPRFNYYDKRNCTLNEISLNKYLRRSTNDLDDWSRIDLSVKTNPEKYGGESQQKDLEIVLKKKYKFDIDVSFPAGLVTISKDPENAGKISYSNLYGISMAMVAQFAFYHPEKIAKLRPYRIGVGFLALDAFNFQSEMQDLAMVAVISLYPTSQNKKLSFPLYLGGGYQFKAQKWMMLIGPGISVRL